MNKEKTAEKLNRTLSIKSRSEEALALEKKKLEITEELEKLMAEYAKATGKKHLKRKSKKDTDKVYSSITSTVKDVLADRDK